MAWGQPVQLGGVPYPHPDAAQGGNSDFTAMLRHRGTSAFFFFLGGGGAGGGGGAERGGGQGTFYQLRP